ncbi:hypothetical protein [Natronosalvus rutilus]|uniref:Uncharacterized protein n=1 Tax=Natronosalvus rutilus TaxID=2953753 RepID=A0A9E7NFS1_9EURY|nr:hypothetical protein [Natronosalvus rutilus]UTF55987.1 hypothetical protein NGM29_21070 [Natronosalvus rutilus]
MPRTYYAHPVDVLGKIIPTFTEEQLQADELFAYEDEEWLLSKIEEYELKLENETGHAWRERRVGSPGHRATYESWDIDFWRYQNGATLWLDHREAVPLDPEAGDELLIRTGRDRWKNITASEGTMWMANYDEARLRIFGHRYRGNWRKAGLKDNVRITYRYGALGGDENRGGQTTLTSQVGTEETTFEVADASRLPARGVVLIGGTEYGQINSIDPETGAVTVTRGTRRTQAKEHDAGEVVHYCPSEIRAAVAARVAVEFIQTDHIGDNLPTPDDDLTFSSLIENLKGEWDQALRNRSEARML